jgi:hypothetical protein
LGTRAEAFKVPIRRRAAVERRKPRSTKSGGGTRADGAPLVPRARLKSVLDILRQTPSGPARITNLLDGLQAAHVRPLDVQQVAASTGRARSDTAWDVYADLLDAIRRLHGTIYFRRPSPPDADCPVALVLERPLFDQEYPPSIPGLSANQVGEQAKKFRLFGDEYIKTAKSCGKVSSHFADGSELADLLEYIRDGLRNGIAGEGLGAAGRAVFVTRVDRTWDELTRERFRGDRDPMPSSAAADRVCDVLGLPYRNCWVVELRSRCSLGELIEKGKLSLAAPTVLEAWGFDQYRHWPRRGDTDRWGRTLHARDGAVGHAMPEGLPEAIIDRLPRSLLAEDFEVSILGQASQRWVPQPREVMQYLAGNRDVAAMVDDIVTLAMR